MDKFKSVVIFGLVVLGMGVEASASTSVGTAYGKCKTELKERFGEDTRIGLKGSKKYGGSVTVKLSVVPEGAKRQTLLCKVTSDVSLLSSHTVLVLTTKEGKPLS
jgi:hypothetical protein